MVVVLGVGLEALVGHPLGKEGVRVQLGHQVGVEPLGHIGRADHLAQAAAHEGGVQIEVALLHGGQVLPALPLEHLLRLGGELLLGRGGEHAAVAHHLTGVDLHDQIRVGQEDLLRVDVLAGQGGVAEDVLAPGHQDHVVPAVVGGAGDTGGVVVPILPVDGLPLLHLLELPGDVVHGLLVEGHQFLRLLLLAEERSAQADLLGHVGVVPSGDHHHLDAEGLQLLDGLLHLPVPGHDQHLGVQGHDLLIVVLVLAEGLLLSELGPVDAVLGGVDVHAHHAVPGAHGPDELIVVAVGHAGPGDGQLQLQLPAQVVHEGDRLPRRLLYLLRGGGLRGGGAGAPAALAAPGPQQHQRRQQAGGRPLPASHHMSFHRGFLPFLSP